MSQDFLSRDEVDALMQGVGSGAGAAADAAGGRLRTVDLAAQERATRTRMPALDMVGERFAERLKAILFDELRRTPAITVVALRATRYGQLIEELGAPAHVTVVDMKPLAGNGLVTVDAGLVGVFVDALFGGGSVKAAADARAFTPTEERLIDRIVVLLLAAYGACWRDVGPLAPQRLRTEVQPRFVQLCDVDEMVYVARFAIDIGTGGGALQIVLPRSLLAPLRERLQAASRDDQHTPRNDWRAPLSAALAGVEIELAAVLAHCQLKLSDLLQMKVGDQFAIEVPDRVMAAVNGVPMFECRYGVAGGRYALAVTRVLPPPAPTCAP